MSSFIKSILIYLFIHFDNLSGLTKFHVSLYKIQLYFFHFLINSIKY